MTTVIENVVKLKGSNDQIQSPRPPVQERAKELNEVRDNADATDSLSIDYEIIDKVISPNYQESPAYKPQIQNAERTDNVSPTNRSMSPDKFIALLNFVKQMSQKNSHRTHDCSTGHKHFCDMKQPNECRPTASVQESPQTTTSGGIEKEPATAQSKFKNVDPQQHCLLRNFDCKECNEYSGYRRYAVSLVSHYVNRHPNTEIPISRLHSTAAMRLRSRRNEKCESFQNSVRHTLYKQFCYFCNVSLSYTRAEWILHMSKHTGYYRYKCNHCSMWYVMKPAYGECIDVYDFDEIGQPQYQQRDLFAFVCNLCNFVRFREHEIVEHLANEHEDDDTTKYTRFKFLQFPTWSARRNIFTDKKHKKIR